MSKILKFKQPMSPFREGDQASFDDKMADKIIEAGFAEEVSLESTKLKKKE